MRQLGIQLLTCTNIGNHPTDRDAAAAPDRSTATSPRSSRTGADLTYVKTLQGILYLAVLPETQATLVRYVLRHLSGVS
jgi:hypothetical protein